MFAIKYVYEYEKLKKEKGLEELVEKKYLKKKELFINLVLAITNI